MTMRRAVLAWEIGGGRGHVITLRVAAEALARIGVRCTAAALVHQEHADELAPFVGCVRQAPELRLFSHWRPQRGVGGMVTYADWLGDHGLFSADLVLRQLELWRSIYAEERPDIVVADQSPLALIAARSLGIATAAIGIWATLPPPQLANYPSVTSASARPLWVEAQLLDAINAATARFGGPYLSRLPEVFASDAELCCSPKFLDLYSQSRASPLLPTIMPPLDILDGPHDEVFVYYSAGDRSDPVTLAAALSLPLPTRVYIPNADRSLLDVFRGRRVRVEQSAVPPTEMVRRSRVALHAGNHGIAALCLRAGLIFVAQPRQHEQAENARRAEAEGVAISVPAGELTVPRLHEAILELYESRSARDRARALAQRLAPDFSLDPREAIAQRLRGLFH